MLDEWNDIEQTPDPNTTRNALFALFMLFVYPVIWVLIAHFILHF